MGIIGKACRILRCQRGASFMFVLGCMLLLLAVTGSLLFASFNNANAAMEHRLHTQMELLADSVQDNIRHSILETDDLAAWVVESICGEYGVGNGIDLNGKTLDIKVNDAAITGTSVKLESVVLNFPSWTMEHIAMVQKTDEVWSELEEGQAEGEQILISPAVPRVPAQRIINAEMIVTVTVKTDDKTLTTKAYYTCTDGIMIDNLGDTYPGTGEEGNITFVLDDSGSWEMTIYEKHDEA